MSDDLEALADAVGVLVRPDKPMTLCDLGAGALLLAAGSPFLVLGSLL